MALTVVAAVIVLDQTMKWWAWRHISGVRINPGGDVLVGPTIGAWYSDPVGGALLDLLDFGVLSVALYILVRRRRPAAVVVLGALMLGGWGSNLLDRLGMHRWTAPGSVRGAVDFICVGGARYNVADFFIIGATPLFLLAVGFLGRGAADRPAMVRALSPAGASVDASAGRHMLHCGGCRARRGKLRGVKATSAHISANGDGPPGSVVAA